MNIHSIESNVKFPDMEHYDMGKASDIALYLAHCDFYPFRSVIENNKIALDISGKFENQIEFSHYQESKEGDIAEIYESNNDNIILKQKYIPLESNFFSIKDFDFIQENDRYERLWEENKELRREIKSQQDEIDKLKIAFDKLYLSIKTGNKASLSTVSLFSPITQGKLDKDSLKKELSLKLNIKLDELKNRFIGFENNKIYLINFASILYSKTTKY